MGAFFYMRLLGILTLEADKGSPSRNLESLEKRMKRISRIVKAASYSWDGLRSAAQKEKAVQDELLVLVPVIVLAFWIGDTALETAVLISSWLLVLLTELLNTAIEAVTDRVGTEWNEYAKQAKDLGSAAVFVALCIAGITWFAVLVS